MKTLRALLIALAALAASVPAASAAQPGTPAGGGRPKVGLVLGGGGARGGAHLGVLEVLEEMRIPFDCVAGTSMGALMSGAYVSGVTPEGMRDTIGKTDWDQLFDDSAGRDSVSLRRKLIDDRFYSGLEFGVTKDGLRYREGAVAGEKIKLFFNELVRADLGERNIEDLPLPLTLIATDIGTGERVAMRSGNLTSAMRASMSVPGAIAPVVRDGRKLVDGGLVDNVPVQEVRDRCGAEVVIAVNVGSPLLKPEQIGSLLSVSAQMVNILTEQNVAQSLATLKPTDIYIKPDLEKISAGDFDKHGEAADRGRAAAEAVAARLQALSVGEQQYAQWWGRFAAPAQKRAPRIDEVEIAGLAHVNPETVQQHISQPPGEPLDTDRLDQDLLRVFGDGWYESVDYTLLRTRERNILRVTPVEKSWGQDYLRLGVNLELADQGSSFDLRVAYQKTWLNRLGGELLLVGQIGSTYGAGVEFYQPLDATQRFFFEPVAGYQRQYVGIYQDDLKIAEYDVSSLSGQLAVGVNVGRLGQVRAGWVEKKLAGSISTGLPFFPSETVWYGGGFVSLDFDQFNRLYFPSAGWAARLSYYHSSDEGFGRLDAKGEIAHTIGRYVLGAKASYAGSPSGRLPFFDAATLGGFLNMSAFAKNQLIGDDVSYAQLRAERIIGTFPIGLRGDMRLGLALEAAYRGNPYSETGRKGVLNSTTLYVGGETPLGPVYLGYGYSTSGTWNVYFFLGTP